MNKQRAEKANLCTKTRCLPWLLVVVGVLVYYNSLSGPFIYDDLRAIVDNRHIRQLLPLWQAMATPPLTSVSGRPVVSLSVAANYAFGGLDVRGYHVLNIVVHILCALVMFGICRRTLLCEGLRRRFGQASHGLAFTCALFWMVHPIQTECVNYISQRTESIMVLFYLLTLYCAVRALDSARHYWWHVASVLSCALGMASKESMVTAPLLVLLYDVVFKSGSIIQLMRRRWSLYAGLAATWGILAVLMWPGPRSDSVGFSIGVSALDYAMNQCIVLVDYLRLAVWPHPLLLDYGFPKPLHIGEVIPYVAVLAVLLIATIASFFYRPMIGFLGAWFFIILGPTSSFIPIATEVGAERRMYLPLAGLIVLVVITVYVLLGHAAKRLRVSDETTASPIVGGFERWAGGVLVIAVAAGLTLGTVRRNEDYSSAVSIWQTVVDIAPRNFRGHTNLGLALQSEGKLDEAISHYHQALQVNPDYIEARTNLGVALQSQGKVDEAINHYRQVLQVRPNDAKAHNNLGNVMFEQGKFEEAISYYRKALQIAPDYAKAHSNLGIVLSGQGRFDEAISHFRQALHLRPDDAKVHSDFGNMLLAQGRLDEAISHFRRSLQLNPIHAPTHYNLGIALQSQGKLNEAIGHYRQALQIGPNDADAHNNLGNVLLSQGKFDEAISHYRQTLLLKPDYAKSHNNLGIALSAQGRFDEAIDHFRQALHLSPDDAKVHSNLGNTLSAQGRLDEAINHFRQSLQLNPNHAITHYNLAIALQSQGKFDEAINEYRRVMQINPGYRKVRKLLEAALKEQKNLQ